MKRRSVGDDCGVEENDNLPVELDCRRKVRSRPPELQAEGSGRERRESRRTVEQELEQEGEEEAGQKGECTAGGASAKEAGDDDWDENDDVCLSVDALLRMTCLGPLQCLLLHQVRTHRASGGNMLCG